MRSALFLIILIVSFNGQAQIKPSTTNYSFGELYRGSDTYTDITFKNTSGKMQFLLTIDKPTDVYYIFSAKRIQPDSSITIRFKVNDLKKGRFSHSIDVYFSEPRTPITIHLSGNIKETAGGGSLTACPDFNAKPPDSMNEFYMVVKVIDSLSREPIPNAKIYVIENGEMVGSFVTNFKGVIKKKMMLGYYYITASKDPYNSNYYEGYMNYNRNYVEIELSQYPVTEPAIEEPVIEEPPEEIVEVIIEDPPEEDPIVEEPPVETIEIVINEDPPEEIPETVEPAHEPVVNEPPIEEPLEPTTLAELPDSVFTPGYFKYNNITFILDVSLSMNGMGKLDLLKLSMIELTKILRKEDVISMIKFSAEVETILPGASGESKEEIKSSVQSLKATSFTAGGDAIKVAYKLNRKNYIEGGNNMVIMITDGVFNRGDKNYLDVIKKNYDKYGIKFSVVGIKTSDYITKHMKTIVDVGAGDFIRILTVDDAMVKLIEEIKKNSFRF
jgi:Ca-activated chloride channel homolog